MAKQRIILISVVCLSIAVFAGQTPSQKPISPFPPRLLPGMTDEEYKKEMGKWIFQRRQQRLKREEERIKLLARQAWQRLLRINERQWELIEPKYEKVSALEREMWARARGSRGRDEQSFHWHRHSEGTGSIRAKAPEEITEGERIVDELIDLLEDEKSTDESIRRKIDALQQAREKARKALPRIRQELAKVLTTPRQEAVFLLMGRID